MKNQFLNIVMLVHHTETTLVIVTNVTSDVKQQSTIVLSFIESLQIFKFQKQ